MKTTIILAALSWMLPMSLAQAATVQGAEAKEVYSVMQKAGQTKGRLEIWGYVTEKADPLIKYDRAVISTDSTKKIVVYDDGPLFPNVVATFERVGIKRVHHDGGTVYIEYTANVNCDSDDLCTIDSVN